MKKLLFLLVVFIEGCVTHGAYEATSNVENVSIYCGKDKNNLKFCHKTPMKQSGSSLMWSEKYFQAKKDGYLDSEIVYKTINAFSDNINIHFDLTPFEEHKKRMDKAEKKERDEVIKIINGKSFGVVEKYIDDNPKHIKYVDDPLIKLKLIGQKNMRITDIKNLLNKEIDDSIVISVIKNVKEPYKEFTLTDVALLNKFGISNNIIKAMIDVTKDIKANIDYDSGVNNDFKQELKNDNKVIQNDNNENAVVDSIKDEIVNQGMKQLFDNLF
jgi:hypothetical protein